MTKFECNKCKTNVDEKTNFCPICGEGLTPMAKELRRLENENAQLILLGNLLTILKNKQDILIIKNLIAELKNINK